MKKSYKIKFRFCVLVLLSQIFITKVAGQDLPNAYLSGSQTNFVRTWTANAPEQNQDNLITRPLRDVKQSTQYIDGLGRLVQTVAYKGSLVTFPTATADMVIPVIYDANGREVDKFLPYVAATSDGLYKTNPFYKQAAFYSDNTNGTIKNQGETYYYNKTDYEASNLERPSKTYPPGNNWVGSMRGPDVLYMNNTNTGNDIVRIWNVDASGNFTSSGAYPAGVLFKSVTRDERGMETDELKNKEGKVILKKAQIGGSAFTPPATPYLGWLCTYYIYDDLGNLRCVIQPKGVELVSSNWVLTDATILAEQCFLYNYDGRNRMILKKVPGAGTVNMVYDSRDRLVMTQDANLAALSKWMVTLYDALNRPVQTGLLLNTYSLISGKTVPQIQSDASVSSTYPFTESTTPATTYWEKLTATHYDDYINIPTGLTATLNSANVTASNFITSNFNISPDYAQAVTQATQTTGLVTWTQTKILCLSQYLSQVNFYDERGSQVQSQTLNQANGVDVTTTQYDFSGKIIRSHTLHQKSTAPAQTYQIATKNTYDDLGRLTEVDKNFNNAGYVVISTQEFDAMGQMNKKTIGSTKDPSTNTYYSTRQPIETLGYDYNIRGWLLGENRDYAKTTSSTANYFGFDLGYDKTIIAPSTGVSIGTYVTPTYNENIGGMVWKSKGDGEIRKYDFNYDFANRLMKADFNQYTSGTFNKNANVDFSMKMGDGVSATSAYDANGNIKRMQQWGLKIGSSSQIDDLTYNYLNTGYSNKLLNVADAFNDNQTTLGDFRVSALNPVQTKTTTTVDYTYDANGNLVIDLNKDLITSAGANGIQYNYLNLPTIITVKKDATSNKGTITYTYDAGGNKQKKVTVDNSITGKTITNTTTYINGFVYESKITVPIDAANPDYTDVLQFTPHEDGRIRRKTDGTFAYDYFIKDHLGNVRMVLTDEVQQDIYPAATLEASKLATEQLYYNVTSGQIVDKSIVTGLPAYQNNNVIPNPPVNPPFDNANSIKLYKLNKNSQNIGLGITLRVMSGDKLDVYGKSYYFQNNTGGTAANTAVTTLNILTGLLGGPTGGATNVHGAVNATQLNGITGTTALINTLLGNQTNNNNATPQVPKAFINYILFDDQFKCIASGFAPVGANNVLTDYAAVAALHNIPVTKNGFVYIYCSNESPVDVFFDNLQVVQTRGPILSEDHYYPYGERMFGICSNAAGKTENKKKYNGIDWQNDLGLNEYDAELRDLDPQDGRWWQIDPETESMEMWSPYASNYDNPILYQDPRGNEGEACCGVILDALADAGNKIMISASGVVFGAANTISMGMISSDPFSLRPRLNSEEKMYFDNARTVGKIAPLFAPGAHPAEVTPELAPAGIPKSTVKMEPGSPKVPISNTKQSNSNSNSSKSSNNNKTTTENKPYSKKEARENAKQQKENQPASEGYAKYKAKELEKAAGKDARREAHDEKQSGGGDRTKKQLDEDYIKR